MGFRRSVGITDLEKLQQFKVLMQNKKKFMYEMHDDLNELYESLSALFKSSVSTILRYISIYHPCAQLCHNRKMYQKFRDQHSTAHVY